MSETITFFSIKLLDTILKSLVTTEHRVLVYTSSPTQEALYILPKRTHSTPPPIAALRLQDDSAKQENNLEWLATHGHGPAQAPDNFGCAIAFRTGVLTVECRDPTRSAEVRQAVTQILAQQLFSAEFWPEPEGTERHMRWRIELQTPNYFALSQALIPIDVVAQQCVRFGTRATTARSQMALSAMHMQWRKQRYYQQILTGAAADYYSDSFQFHAAECIEKLLIVARQQFSDTEIGSKMQEYRCPEVALSELAVSVMLDDYIKHPPAQASATNFRAWCRRRLREIQTPEPASPVQLFQSVRQLYANSSVDRLMASMQQVATWIQSPCASIDAVLGCEVQYNMATALIPDRFDYYDKATVVDENTNLLKISCIFAIQTALLTEIDYFDQLYSPFVPQALAIKCTINTSTLDINVCKLHVDVYVLDPDKLNGARLIADCRELEDRSDDAYTLFENYWNQAPNHVSYSGREARHAPSDVLADAAHARCIQAREDIVSVINHAGLFPQPIKATAVGALWGI